MKKEELIHEIIDQLKDSDKHRIESLEEKMQNLQNRFNEIDAAIVQMQGKTKREMKDIARRLKVNGAIPCIKYGDSPDKLKDFLKIIEAEINRISDRISKISSRTDSYYRKIAEERFMNGIFYDNSESIRCTSYDEQQLFPVLEEDFIRIHNFGDASDGGYSQRFTKLWFSIINEGEVNEKEAYLFEVGIATYYEGRIRGVKKKRYLTGWDDGHLFLTQVYSTCMSVQEAIDRLTPKKVREAIEQGREVKRQGDLWFVKIQGDTAKYQFTETEIRPGHRGMYNSKHRVATGKIVHREHGVLNLGNDVWKVYRNAMVSRSRAGYD